MSNADDTHPTAEGLQLLFRVAVPQSCLEAGRRTVAQVLCPDDPDSMAEFQDKLAPLLHDAWRWPGSDN